MENEGDQTPEDLPVPQADPSSVTPADPAVDQPSAVVAPSETPIVEPPTPPLDGRDCNVPRVRRRRPRRHRLLALVLAAVAFCSAWATLYDPGLVVDEPLNVGMGQPILAVLRNRPGDMLDPNVVDRLFRLHDHPPLARLLLALGQWWDSRGPAAGDPGNPESGRIAAAIAYAVLVWTTTRLGQNVAGPFAGLGAGASVLLMPRLFAHAHFASLDMISTALTMVALRSVCGVVAHDAIGRLFPYSMLRAAGAGVFLGLALLTKLTAIILPAAIVVAALCRWRLRVVPLLAMWLLVGGIVFVAGWPWLWPLDLPGYPPGWAGALRRLGEFLNVGLHRATVYVWYFGRQYPNAEGRVPWHYVWVVFAATVPVGLHVLAGVFGLPRMLRDWRMSPAALFVVALIAAELAIFTLPIDKYDGERLFLTLFPCWAVVAGVGLAAARDRLLQWRLPGAVASCLLLAAMASQAYGVVHFHPCQLSYYNLLVGGLPGAERLGLEVTYWGDTLTRPFLDRCRQQANAREGPIALFPTLADSHPANLSSTWAKQRLVPGHQFEAAGCRRAIHFHRDGYLHDPVPAMIQANGTVEQELAIDGVWLTRLYQIPNPHEPANR